MTRQLRLASGVLTDVGRKRERNQDNVTSFVPEDPETLEERGALFVVCDGMGGHAAGEVASEKGVNTIREVYFASQGQDTITSIAQAVKAANDAIFSLARARTEYSGMGTTCVALVIAGGRAYIVNIGDSRAYIIRNGEMRQVTQDHSWVAEQVRIGLLSEEQARVHAHRNVITRSLGTQSNITADLFVETLHDGDRVLLCSDGLHGYVEEGAIMQEVVTQSEPDVAVHNLIDMANANGGPDNISAIVVDILEAPEVTGPIPLPANTAEPIEEGATQPLPVPTQITPAATAIAETVAAAPVTAAPSAPATSRPQRKRSGLLALRLLEVAALLLIIFTAWYVGFGPLATQRAANQAAQNNLTTARRIIQQSSSQPPAAALHSLSQARSLALSAVNNTALDATVRTQARSLLSRELAPAVQQALQRYNAGAAITLASVNSKIAYTIQCPSPITATAGLVPVPAAASKPTVVAGNQVVFLISGGMLYEALIPVDANNTPVTGQVNCAPVTIKGVSAYLSIVGSGASVYALAQLTAGGYSVLAVTPGALSATGAPTMKATTFLTLPATKLTPTHLAVAGRAAYVSFAGGTPPTYGVWYFSGLPKATVQTIPLQTAVTSMLALNDSLYMLTADGALGQLNAARDYASLVVTAALPATTTDPATYTAATPVPTPQNPTTTPGTTVTPTSTVTAPTIGATFGSGATLTADPLDSTQMLLSDPATHRIIHLLAAAGGPGAQPVGQYVYGAPLTDVGDVAMTGSGSTLNAYIWSGSQLITFTLPEAASGA